MPDSAGTAFGAILRGHRLSASLSQEKLAERAGISPDAVAALERGRRSRPRPDTVALLADALGLAAESREAFIAAATASRAPAAASRAPTTAPVHREQSRLPSRLPQPPTILVGRERDEAAVAHLLGQRNRLITLVGPGGVGKTRLAIQVATGGQASYADGAAFVDLAAVREPDQVASVIGHTLGLPERGRGGSHAGTRAEGNGPSKRVESPAEELLIEQLHPRRVLLVLDNLEQVLDVRWFIADLIERCPELAIIATSRSPLNIRGEQLFSVPPLSIPGPGVDSIEQLANYGAVQLFVGRAQAAQPSFTLTQANAESVAEICRRLDGLPLAIELAAARVRLFNPEALLARLDRSLTILTAGPRDLPERQQTLRDTIAWSYDLLEDDEKKQFRRLGVFFGGFTFGSAQAILSHDSVVGAGHDDVLASVESLLDKSLLQPMRNVGTVPAEGALSQTDAEPRFTMLDTVREYALERLEANGEITTIRERHAAYFVSLAEEADPHLRSGDRNRWLERLLADSENFRAALTWCSGQVTAPPSNSDKPLIHSIESVTLTSPRPSNARPTPTPAAHLGLRLAVALTWFWRFHERLAEGRFWLETMLAATQGEEPSVLRGQALYGVAMLAWYQGDVETAATQADTALAMLRESGDARWLATVLRLLGLVRMRQGDPQAARHVIEESRDLFHQLGDQWGEAMALYRLGLAAVELREPEAQGFYEESLRLFRRIRDPLGESVVLNARGVAAAAAGDDTAALADFTRGLALARKTTDRWDLARLLTNIGTLRLRMGDDQRAERHFKESLRLWQEIGHHAGIALGLAGLGELAAMRGQPERAGKLLGAAQRISPETDPFVNAASASNLDRRLAGARDLIALQRSPVTHARLDAGAFDAGWSAGQTLSPDEAIDSALGG